MRVGFGYDVHRLVPGRRLVIGGVGIAHTHGLAGHSDADVLLHAIADALLGAAALGDIGQHFPSTDEWKGVLSSTLLKSVTQKVGAAGYRVANIDATVAAEQPQLRPHISTMRKAIALAVGIHHDKVSVKATTTDTLGFCGRQEGIAAWAVCLIERRRNGVVS